MVVVHRIHSTYDYDETPEEGRSPDNEASRPRPTVGASTQDRMAERMAERMATRWPARFVGIAPS